MTREWKPGDVATWPGMGVVICVGRDDTSPIWSDTAWAHRWGGFSHYDGEEIRPLVVIDPENREQVERLRAALGYDHYYGTGGMLAASLREFANPPTPEPTDPKARVTDRRENIWRLLADGDWVCTSGPDIGEYLTWDRLATDRGPLQVTQ